MSDDHNYPVARRKEFHCPWFEKEKQMITALRAENERLKTSGIVEVAAHNPSVMDYMRHWEGRTQKAEAENERLRAALSGILREWHEYTADEHSGDVPFIVGVTMAGIARAALEEKS